VYKWDPVERGHTPSQIQLSDMVTQSWITAAYLFNHQTAHAVSDTNDGVLYEKLREDPMHLKTTYSFWYSEMR